MCVACFAYFYKFFQVRVNVVNLATPQLQNLYTWLEVDFHPLLLCSRVYSVIESLQAEENTVLQQYIQPLQDVTLVRLVRQIAQVYQTIEFARLIELALFTDLFHMERLLVDCVRHNDMQIRYVIIIVQQIVNYF